MKNPTPRQLAGIAAALLLLISTFTLLLIRGNALLQDREWVYLVYLVLISGAAFVIFSYLLRQFIYRKIKLIYKNIHNLKASKNEPLKDIQMDEDIISEVEAEVMDWAEDKKVEIDELKKMEAYRKEFLGNVTHELRTPIFNITGYIETLLEGGLDDEKINREYLYKASRSAERLASIVNDLEAISKLEAGRLKMNMERFDIHQLAKEVMEESEMAAEAHHVKLRIKDGCDKPFYVTGDREKIAQVLQNLVINAIKYGKEDGQVLIGFYDMDRNILTEITDDGPGIDEKHISRLFERFYRVDESRARAEGGTGLGLAIVKHIIEAHSQTINVRSTPGVGSTFGFTLKKAS